MNKQKYRGPQTSTPRYHCKYCDVWTNDDKPSRDHHESGGRHKGNVERWIRGLYKQGAEEKRAKANSDREMAAIESAAQRSIAKDLGIRAGPAKSVQPEDMKAKKPRRPMQAGGSNYGYGFGQIAFGARGQESEQGGGLGPSETRIGQWEVVKPMSTMNSAVRMLQEQDQDQPSNQRLAIMTFEADESVEIAPFEMKKRRPRPEVRVGLNQKPGTSQDSGEKEEKLEIEENISAPTDSAEPLLRAKDEEERAVPQNEDVVSSDMFRKRKRTQARVS